MGRTYRATTVATTDLPSLVRRALSTKSSAVEAVRDVLDQLTVAETELILLFCSAQFSMHDVAHTVSDYATGATVMGCTTAGEITPAGYRQGSIVGLSLPKSHFSASVGVIKQLANLDVARGLTWTTELRDNHAPSCQRFTQPRTFAVALSDGFSMREEMITSAVGQALGTVPLVGGSAGYPQHATGEATLFLDGKVLADAALIALVTTDLDFRVFQTQHFELEDPRLVITKADPDQRLVAELNAEPAATEYARILGLRRDDLTPYVFAAHPLAVRAGGRHYVRAIQRADEQDHLHFYCAIDEGVVLSLAHSSDLLGNLDTLFTQLKRDLGSIDAILGFECILRYTEIEQRQILAPVSQLLLANKVVGFNTYGEQFGMMHVSQTFTGIAFGHGT